ncbi:hypothetical protein [Flavobacterium sp. FlaQc-30]|uniref:hypothetical protein n=1 Tax=Flavobacterium sp. FlaQc-30 TaxID=3374179 RepID=UPI003756DF14
MKKIFYFFSLMITVLISGCGRTWYYSNECYSLNFINVDSASNVFIRKLYLNENFEKTKDSISLSNKINRNNTLIEVQYLIFNPNREVIYIATTPSRYIYDKTDSYLIHSGKKTYPNGFYLNTFYFGIEIAKPQKNIRRVEFKNNKMAQEWSFNIIDKDYMNLSVIDNYKIKRVFVNQNKMERRVFVSTENVYLSSNHEVAFEKVDNFRYLSFKIPDDKKAASQALNKNVDSLNKTKYTIYDEHCQKKDTFSSKILYPKANKIYFKYWNNKLEYIFIPFSQPVKGYHSIKFNCDRVKFSRPMQAG